jgi:hypothetical protein
VPHRDVSRTAVERFDFALHALDRLAELAEGLRDAGWVVIDRGWAAAIASRLEYGTKRRHED